jgi:hypothetical protein
MKTRIQIAAATCILLITALTSCNNSTSFKLTGSLDGIKEGKMFLTSSASERKTDTVLIQDGKFEFTANLQEPVQYYMSIEGKKRAYLSFYAENCKMTITGNADSLDKAVVSGGKTQELCSELQRRSKELSDKYKINDLYKELYARGGTPVTKEREAEINALLEKYSEESDQLKFDFIKENPKAAFSAIMINQLSSGKSAAEIEDYLSLLDPKLASLPTVIKLREKIEEMKKTEVSMDTFIPNAHNLSYKVDGSFAGKAHTGVVYLSMMSDNNICALQEDGKVLLIDQKGNAKKSFKSGLKSKPSAIAIDESDNIYVFGTVMEQKTLESRGRKTQVNTPVSVECYIFNAKGSKVKEMKLEGVTSATGARVADNNILVANTRGRNIVLFDSETGAKKTSIEGLRTCCGILDFSIRNGNEILVANLGAFRVESFDYTGKQLFSFGQRGNKINDFHGCCNPVSVAFLSNGGIVTVEKDPTRIKVYSAEGAKQIEGIEELVKGCSYIPMIVDSNNNVYLASKEDGVIKCVSAI